MDKKEIAKVLEEIADLLELKGENPFKVRAYRTASRSLLNFEGNFKKLVEEEKLDELEGVGEHIAEKITELFETGKLAYYEKLKKSTPPGMLQMIQVHGLGPKKVKALHKKKIRSIEELKTAAEKGKVAKIRGFGKKSAQNILDSLAHREAYQKRTLWWDAMTIAEPILEGLKKLKGVQKAEIAGSLRRKLETVGDLDFLVAASNPKPIMKWFTSLPGIQRVLASGETKSSVKLEGGIQADLRVVKESEFGYALCYFTGSKEHNIKLRDRALSCGWSLSEYGLAGARKTKKAATEEDLYKILGFSYIEPELREDRGELQAAEKKKLPHLIEVKDIRGTLHNHTTSSDGKSTLREMAAAAKKMGWEYLGISDHSKSSFQANGMDEKRLLAQVEEIRKLNASKSLGIYLFSGLECDILADGKLDFPKKILDHLDYVIGSVHASLTQNEKAMTRRIIKAVENPSLTILGHLTGRLLLRREPSRVDAQKVIDACIANNKIIELNGHPLRLDMDWRLWHKASEKGLLCCINTDAHHADNHQFILSGVNAARKGWLEKSQVINTVSLKEMQKLLKSRKN
ncbi:MAG: DNA polymerase/3'-5' exonuclease PolX [Verrucomicrobia bacterium]|nr:DNA polymerase/3'-5' exonuclease PolX [Verrucomicrobiota bacterium]